jgi:FMN reductase
MKVVGIGGSLAAQSSSLAALKIALEGAAEGGARTELFDVRALDRPGGRAPTVRGRPQGGRLVMERPLYHGTISGSFKNALDWLRLLSDRKPAFLTDKVVGLISTAGGTLGL